MDDFMHLPKHERGKALKRSLKKVDYFLLYFTNLFRLNGNVRMNELKFEINWEMPPQKKKFLEQSKAQGNMTRPWCKKMMKKLNMMKLMMNLLRISSVNETRRCL